MRICTMPIDKVCSAQNIWWPLSALPINCRAPIGGLFVGIFIRFLKRQHCWLNLMTQFSFPKKRAVIAQLSLSSSSYMQPHLSVCMWHRKGFRSLQISSVSPSVVGWWTFSGRKAEIWFLGSEPVPADFRAVTIMWNKCFEIFRGHILKAEYATLKKRTVST